MENTIDYNLLLSPSEIYHENSKLHAGSISLYTWIGYVNSHQGIRQIICRPHGLYAGYPKVELPKTFEKSTLSFEEIIASRRSFRQFSREPMGINTLSTLLYDANGVTSIQHSDDGSSWSLRTTPSGGGLFPIELYCIVVNVEGLESGLYYFNAIEHMLYQIEIGSDVVERLSEAMPALNGAIESCNVCFLMNSVLTRIKFKYGERAYRFALMEVGHIGQNILLGAESLGLGAFCVGGFLDDNLNAIIRVDGVTEAVQYSVLVGNK